MNPILGGMTIGDWPSPVKKCKSGSNLNYVDIYFDFEPFKQPMHFRHGKWLTRELVAEAKAEGKKCALLYTMEPGRDREYIYTDTESFFVLNVESLRNIEVSILTSEIVKAKRLTPNELVAISRDDEKLKHILSVCENDSLIAFSVKIKIFSKNYLMQWRIPKALQNQTRMNRH